MLHHYTSIETLSLILRSKKIRFNRLDRVDDMGEATTFGEHSLAPFLFVSCWTDIDEENIPLWNMYTGNMRGVRLSFPGDPFLYRIIPKQQRPGLLLTEDVLSPLSIEQMFGERHFVMPSFLKPDRFGSKVSYIEDVQGIYADALKIAVNSDGTFSGTGRGPGDIAVHKRKEWAFQHEYRFVLYILPTPGPISHFIHSDSAFASYSNHIAVSLVSGQGPKFQYFDLEIDPKKLEEMTVTVGPMATLAERTIVESLLQAYCGHRNVSHSRLHGSIRART
jgi:hypothetical protein